MGNLSTYSHTPFSATTLSVIKKPLEVMTALHSAYETFLQVCGCAWKHLKDVGATACIRATCRDGRRVHDSVLDELTLDLSVGPDGDNEGDDDIDPDLPPPTPDQLRSLMTGLLGRGAKLKHLELVFPTKDVEDSVTRWSAKDYEDHLLAVLESCSSCPVASLELAGDVPHTRTVSEAVATCCPHLAKLKLDYVSENNPSPYAPMPKRAYTSSAVPLIEMVGPQLRELVVIDADHWTPQCIKALSHCTALSSLELFAQWWSRECYVDVDLEAQLLSTVGTLTQLRSLHLNEFPVSGSPDAVRPHATCLAHLGALTALTSLHLQMSAFYIPAGDSWRRQQEDRADDFEAWEEVRKVQRTSLLSALRAMPQLQHLECSKLLLRPSEVASLAALTSLEIGELQLPWQPLAEGVAVAFDAWPLPPQLRQLTLPDGVSPSALAALQPPLNHTVFDVPCIRFGMFDVSPDCRVLPKAAQDFGQAVGLLAHCASSSGRRYLLVDADFSDEGPMEPPEGWAQGHAGWIKELAVLDQQLEGLTMHGIRLRVGDIACVVSTLPGLRDLELAHTPTSALHALTGLQRLESLTLDLTHCEHLTTDELEAALCLLCKGVPSLKRVTASCSSSSLSTDACRQSVEGQLAAWGRPTPSMIIWNNS